MRVIGPTSWHKSVQRSCALSMKVGWDRRRCIVGDARDLPLHFADFCIGGGYRSPHKLWKRLLVWQPSWGSAAVLGYRRWRPPPVLFRDVAAITDQVSSIPRLIRCSWSALILAFISMDFELPNTASILSFLPAVLSRNGLLRLTLRRLCLANPARHKLAISAGTKLLLFVLLFFGPNSGRYPL